MKQQYRWLIVVAMGLLAIVAMDVWWAVTYRDGFPLTIDEAGYIAFGLQEHFGLQSGGLHGWWDAVLGQAPYAPLVPAATSLVFSIKAGVMGAFMVLIAFMVLLVFATYGIAERLAGPRLGALAALVVATSPGTFFFVREYVFAIAVAALLSCAVYALLRSDGLRLRRWAIACGVALGLMLLARTMTIAFVPVVLVAGLVTALVRSSQRGVGEGAIGRRLFNLGLVIVLGFAVAAPWYLPKFDPVFDYLTDYGYGAQAAYYGADHSLISWFRLREVANRMTAADLLVPLAVIVMAGLVAVAVMVVRRTLAAEDRRKAIVSLLAGDAFTVAFVVAGCYAALTSSRNGGEGFTFPVAMLLPPLAVIALRRASTAVLASVLGALCLVVGLNVAFSSSQWESLAKVRNVSIPAFGSLPWINGTPKVVSTVREQTPGPPTRFVEADKGWVEANRELANTVLELSEEGYNQPVGFASRNRTLNSSSLLLAGLLNSRQSIWMAQLQAEPDTVANYERQLSGPELGHPGILVTMNREQDDFEPIVTQRKAEAAARKAGFKKVRRMSLPDGRQLFVWVRKASPS